MKKFVLLPSEKYERLLKESTLLPSLISESKDSTDDSLKKEVNKDITGSQTLNKNPSDVIYHIKLVPPPGEPEDSFYI